MSTSCRADRRSASALLVATALLAALGSCAETPPPPGMVRIPGGTFLMGSDGPLAQPHERPQHTVRISAFWLDVHEVTNAEFARFVEATGWVTVAERWIDSVIPPGALVFDAPSERLDPHATDVSGWWSNRDGAHWRMPEGPGSSIDDRLDHPVVHIAFEDANAYAAWAGKRLPTEAEWEYAAHGGLDGATYPWGEDDPLVPVPRANIWQGTFPSDNTVEDGWYRTAPVGSYAPNGYGLFDMAGNVWEWTADRYRDDRNAQLAKLGVAVDPAGPPDYRVPRAPHEHQRVTKGGSFLCHASYCLNYRTSSRNGTEELTGLCHTGFRCAR